MWFVALLFNAPLGLLIVFSIFTTLFIFINVHKVKYHIYRVVMQDDALLMNYLRRDTVCEVKVQKASKSITIGRYLGMVTNYHLKIHISDNDVIRQHAMCGWKYEDIDSIMNCTIEIIENNDKKRELEK